MGALTGYKVLDLSILVQGPQAAAMMHDLGAEVIQIELPEVGDLGRAGSPSQLTTTALPTLKQTTEANVRLLLICELLEAGPRYCVSSKPQTYSSTISSWHR